MAAKDVNDCDGCKDPALFSRMPGFYISDSRDLDFDQFEFPVSSDKNLMVRGRHYFISYYANSGITFPSGLQIAANYAEAARNIGGETVYEFEDGGTQYVILKVVNTDGAEVWTMVDGASNGMYNVNIVEKKPMKQDVVADAQSLANTISQTGRAAVYGIYFDTGKSDIKPESGPALDEIVKMLNADSTLKLYVVGHTDNVGPFDYNIRLSQSRAAAVIDALVKKNSIPAARLTPFGAGPTAPVASNSNEEGRARNRRVELVAQ
ncbi:MAG: OmpA family protein [Pseudomonadota bacterium]